jgi:hypothetical protein
MVLFHFKRNYFSGTLPNLDAMGADKPLGGDNGRRVIRATQRFKSLDAAVAAK